MNFVTYSKRTGEIIAHGKAPRLDWLKPIGAHEANLATDAEYSGDTHYVDLRTMKVMRKRPSRAGAAGNLLVGLPIGGKLHVHGQVYPIEEEQVELAFNIPGPHEVKITSTEWEDATILLGDE